MMATRIEISMGYKGPKSVCACTHAGDGPGSSHAGPIGHGPCLVRGCRCTKFTWAQHTDAFAKALEKADAA